MATKARASFEDNWAMIECLSTVGEEGVRSHQQRAAVNRAALVFVITAWESYVEDVLRECSEFLAEHCPSFSELPKSVRQAVVLKVTPEKGPGTKSPSGNYPAELADSGWRTLLRKFAKEATEGGNFNTPSTANVKDLFEKWLGIDVTQAWSWRRFAAPRAAERLDESIKLRGSIVHTGTKPDGLNKNWISKFGESNIRKLVDRTDELLVQHVNDLCHSHAFGQ